MGQGEIDRLRRDVSRGAGGAVVARLLMKLQREGLVDDADVAAVAKGADAWVVVETRGSTMSPEGADMRTFLDAHSAWSAAGRAALEQASIGRHNIWHGDARRAALYDKVWDANRAFAAGERGATIKLESAIMEWNERGDGGVIAVKRTTLE